MARCSLWLAAMLLAALPLQGGCVVIGSKKIEKVPRQERSLRFTEAPPIELVFDDPASDESEHLRKTLEKLRGRFPFLENASESNEEAAYSLRLGHRLVQEGCWPVKENCMALSGYTFLLVPAYDWTVWEYQVSWEDESGATTYHHEGRMKQGAVAQLWLVWALPVNAVTAPLMPSGKRMLRRLLALVERDLAREQRIARGERSRSAVRAGSSAESPRQAHRES